MHNFSMFFYQNILAIVFCCAILYIKGEQGEAIPIVRYRKKPMSIDPRKKVIPPEMLNEEFE